MLLALVLAASVGTETVLEEEPWAQEHRRVHAGVGVRVHGGVLSSGGYPLYALQTEVFGSLSVRVREHDEVRVLLGFSGGWPDSFGGETNVAYLHAFGPRMSLGLGAFAYLGLWSMRAGLEVPLVIRSTSRRHQLILGLRLHTGVFNNVPLTGWKPSNQRLAFAADLAVGYAFQF